MAGGAELLRLIDMIHREREIDPERLFESIELALETAVRKRYELDEEEELYVHIDRGTGEFSAYVGNDPISAAELGRIAAQTAKQVIIQKIREAEQDVLMDEYETRRGELVTGVIQRFEKGDIIVQLAKGEGILPRTEQIRGENYHVGDRMRALVLDVRRIGNRVRIVLSRTTPIMLRRLFELEVPEILDGIVEIKELVREPGYRTKMAVVSYDERIDAVGACVGMRGARIRNVTEEFGSERIDVIPWSDSPEVLIMKALEPAQIETITLDDEEATAEVVVADDQLSLAIGRKGQNVRLAARLTGWDINIVAASKATFGFGSEGGSEGDADGPLRPGAEMSPEVRAFLGEVGEDAQEGVAVESEEPEASETPDDPVSSEGEIETEEPPLDRDRDDAVIAAEEADTDATGEAVGDAESTTRPAGAEATEEASDGAEDASGQADEAAEERDPRGAE